MSPGSLSLFLLRLTRVGVLVTALCGLAAPSARATLAPASSAGSRIVEGRVARMDSRVDELGYPVTDVTLEPGGERFTLLGGYRNGRLWVVDEEARFQVGERVRVHLQPFRSGLWLEGGESAVERLSAAPLDSIAPGGVAHVLAVTPSSGPAVADDDIEVQVHGTGFGAEQDTSGVFFQGLFEHVPATVLAWSDTLIRCLVPRPGREGSPQVLSGSVKVRTPAGWSDGLPFDGGAEYHVLFQYAGDSWSERNLPIPFYLNPDGFPWPPETVEGLLADAIGAWSGAPFAYGRWRYEGRTDHVAMKDKDSLNVVGWTHPWPHNPNWLAVTWSGIDSISGERTEVDTEINGDRLWSVETGSVDGEYDLATTLTHEFGHWIRLGHVQEPDHVMLGFQDPGVLRRVLATGDRQGAAWVYPTFGTVTASRDTVFVGESGTEPLVLSVTIADRRGRPISGLPPGEVFAVAEWLGPVFGSAAGLEPAGAAILPESPTDAEGHTRFVIQDFEGRGRLRFTVVGDARSVRGPAEVVVANAPVIIPAGLVALAAPVPNPVLAGVAAARLTLGSPAARLVARVCDTRGRMIQLLFDGPAPAGERALEWNVSEGRTPSPGLYFFQVSVDGVSRVRKIIVLGS